MFFELGPPASSGAGAASCATTSAAAAGSEQSGRDQEENSSAGGNGAGGDGVAAAADDNGPSLTELLAAREARCKAAAEERSATLAAAASAVGDVRGSAVLGLMSQRLPPELRAKVLAFHPSASTLPKELCKTAKELFDEFIEQELPTLRALGPLAVAPRGSTRHVALLIEPRCHNCLEHVIRNAMLLLNADGGRLREVQRWRRSIGWRRGGC